MYKGLLKQVISKFKQLILLLILLFLVILTVEMDFEDLLNTLKHTFFPSTYAKDLKKPISDREFEDNNNPALQNYYTRELNQSDLGEVAPTQAPRQVVYPEALANAPSPTPTPIVPTPTPPPHKSAEPFVELINQATAQNQLPEHLLYEILRKESMTFNPDVVYGKISSPAGAQGIAQFMPQTAQGLGIDPLNPEEAIPASGKYIADKYKQHGNDWEKALAAYNAGSGNVNKYGGVPPFKETQDYVAEIMSAVFGE